MGRAPPYPHRRPLPAPQGGRMGRTGYFPLRLSLRAAGRTQSPLRGNMNNARGGQAAGAGASVCGTGVSGRRPAPGSSPPCSPQMPPCQPAAAGQAHSPSEFSRSTDSVSGTGGSGAHKGTLPKSRWGRQTGSQDPTSEFQGTEQKPGEA